MRIPAIVFFLPILLSSCMQEGARPAGDSPSVEEMFLELVDHRRYLSPDELADKLINQDPELLLVDVRSHEDFDYFSLPGAIHIPFEKILDEENLAVMDGHRYSIVFYSNDDVLAEKAWYFFRQTGQVNTYILEGGLNRWTETIVMPEMPPPTAPKEAFDRYQFRKAARQYFVGGSEEIEPVPFEPTVITSPGSPAQAKKTIEVKPKPKPVIVEEEEGC